MIFFLVMCVYVFFSLQSVSISLFYGDFNFEFLRCRLIGFYCMWLVKLSSEGYSFSMSYRFAFHAFVKIDVSFISFNFVCVCVCERCCCNCHNWFSIYPRSSLIDIIFHTKIGWWRKQLIKTVKLFDKSCSRFLVL